MGGRGKCLYVSTLNNDGNCILTFYFIKITHDRISSSNGKILNCTVYNITYKQSNFEIYNRKILYALSVALRYWKNLTSSHRIKSCHPFLNILTNKYNIGKENSNIQLSMTVNDKS